MAIHAFKRNELKYLLNEKEYKSICEYLGQYMILDSYCKNENSYMIHTIYFDTDDHYFIRESIGKPYYKVKLRLRTYAMPIRHEDKVFLEMKKKVGGVVSKRRAVMSYAQAIHLLTFCKEPILSNYHDQQVTKEIAQFLKQNKVLPKVLISYQRTAYFDKLNPSCRISFDYHILSRRNHVHFQSEEYGDALLDEGWYVMEVKCNEAMPLWLCDYLSSHKIYKTSFSKYGTEYKKYRKERPDEMVLTFKG